MSSFEPIGGFFELELRGNTFPGDDQILLNSGRSCFAYVLTTRKPKKVYMPRYTCSVVFEPLNKLNIPFEFYAIDEKLEIVGEPIISEDELLMYTNYFGIKSKYCRSLSERYHNKLVLDYSQAFFEVAPEGSDTFYSPRKFFGLPDGGILFTNKMLSDKLPIDVSIERMSHLLKRIDIGAEAGYDDFKHNDASLDNQPLKQMSALTHSLMKAIDYTTVKQKREKNFTLLHNLLGSSNKFVLDTDNLNSPMAYPFLVDDTSLRQKLIDKKIFVATYWPNVLEWCGPGELEYRLAKNLLALPIDQRYGQEDMERIARIINE